MRVDGTLRVALAHLASTADRGRGNIATVRSVIGEAAEAGAALVITSDSTILGAEDPTADLTEACALHGVHAAVGLTHPDTAGAQRRGVLLVGPHGPLAVGLDDPAPRHGPPQGTALTSTPWGRVGLLVGDATRRDATPHALANAGAEALIVLAPAGRQFDPRPGWRADAQRHGLTVLACGHGDTGHLPFDSRTSPSAAFGPRGQVWASHAGADEVVILLDVPLVGWRFPTGRRGAPAVRRPGPCANARSMTPREASRHGLPVGADAGTSRLVTGGERCGVEYRGGGGSAVTSGVAAAHATPGGGLSGLPPAGSAVDAARVGSVTLLHPPADAPSAARPARPSTSSGRGTAPATSTPTG